MADDAHIYVRTVRQVLAGNGPTFNVGERVEASTGTLWQWLLVLAGMSGVDIPTAAVYGGALLTATGFALAGLGCRRLYSTEACLPLGCLVLLALPPVWDFATSGLETGLTTCWLAGAWLLLVARPGSLGTCTVLGLGPLVRPDLALVSAVFLGAQWLTVRPAGRQTLVGCGAAVALPTAYEIFRAGYYGFLVPLPAISKDASQSMWGRGFGYLADFTVPYLLWLPAVTVLAAGLLVRGRRASAPLVPVLAPIVAGLLSWAFVVKVGGDFMHGRMLLPGLLLMLLPVFIVPVSRAVTMATIGVGMWAAVCAIWMRTPYELSAWPPGIDDARATTIRAHAAQHPVHHTFAGVPYIVAYKHLVQQAERDGTPTLMLHNTRLKAGAPGVTGVKGVLGYNGTVVPLSGTAIDPIGLAYPLAAHSERINGARPGHGKNLPAEWIVADRGARGSAPRGLDPAKIEAARRALRCGPLAEMRAATTEPLTFGRFLRNLTGAWQRTTFRFPNDPVRAERELCGHRAAEPDPTA
ncbi:flagellar motor control protein ZomB [Streptomyces deserti]